MKLLKLGLIFTTLSLFFFACAQNQMTNTNVASNNTAVVVNSNNAAAKPSATAAADELAAAAKIYSEKCVKCHKENGTGGVTDIEGRKVKAPNFTSEKQKKEPDSEYIEMIEKGDKDEGMPTFKGKISDEDIKNLVKYIRREFQGK